MNQDALDIIAGFANMEVWPDDAPPTAEQLREKLADADGTVINIMDRVDAALLEAAPRLRVISQLAAGLDNVDLSECTKRGIPVGSTPGILSKAVADHGFAMLLSAARRVVESDKWVRDNNWKLQFHPTYWLGAEVQGSTLGIIGLGQIGLEMARRAAGFDMRVCTTPAAASRSWSPSRANLRRLEHAAGRSRLRVVARAADAGYEAHHQRRRPAQDEVHRHPDQPVPGPTVDTDALTQALREGWDWRGGAGRGGPRAHPRWPSVAGHEQRYYHPARRERFGGVTAGDEHNGGG